MTAGRRALIVAGLALPAPSLLNRARAQGAWPDRPVRLIVPFGPGGAIDTLSRFVANRFGAHTNGGTLVVENRPGGGGTIAGGAVATARPDGTTLMMADAGANALAGELVRGAPYDPARAFTPVIHLVNLPLMIVAKRDFPHADLAAALTAARARPEALTFAHPGLGHPTHLLMEMVQRRAGVRFLPVAYRSGAELMTAMASGQADLGGTTISTGAPFVRDGRVKALAVAEARDVEAMPGVPPVAATLPGVTATVWHGIVGPAGLPPELTARMNAVFGAILAEPELQATLRRTQAAVIMGGPPEAFAAHIAAEIARWVPLVREAGIRAE